MGARRRSAPSFTATTICTQAGHPGDARGRWPDTLGIWLARFFAVAQAQRLEKGSIMMRPAQFDARMQEAGWSLARIAANGHHIYHHPSGERLTVDADNSHNASRYLARYAKRDLRRYGRKKAG